MKKVICNALIINDKPTGLGVYSINVLKNIDKKELFQRIIFTDNKFIGDLKLNNIKYDVVGTNKNKILNIIKRNITINKFINNKEINNNSILYSTTQHGTLKKGIKQVITVHDLMPIYYPKGRKHQYFYFKYILPKVMNRCEKIITVSNSTKNDMVREYNIEPSKIEVIYNGVEEVKNINKEKSKEIIKNKYGIDYDYFLMVGINYSYKNLHSVIQAFNDKKNEIKSNLVIVGNNNCSYGEVLKALVKDLNLEDKVKFLGYVDDKFKNNLYQGAKCFIYPSLYEGFGMPVLEAMANETVVACSNKSSLPEVAGDAAIYFDPENLKEIQESLIKIENLCEDNKKIIINKGIKNISRFSWKNCSSEICEVLDSI